MPRAEADRFSVRDRTIVVTGGRGRLGGTFATALTTRGARVALLDLEGGDETERCLSLAADVTDRGALERALERVASRWGTPDVLVNNAGVDAPPDASAVENGPFEALSEASWDRVLDVNTRGTFLASQVFGGAMAAAGRGSIINVGSIYGLVSPDQRLYAHRRTRGEPFFKPAGYAVSKGALYALTRYLATYWAASGVRVNTVTFGGVHAEQDPAFVEAYRARVPMGRMAAADETVGPIVFLASDASSYVTGANLVVDGGFTAW